MKPNRMAQRLGDALASAGVPVDGVDLSKTPPTFTYPVAPSPRAATQAQINAGLAVCAAFDKSAAAQQAWEDLQDPTNAALRDNVTQMVAAINSFLAIPSPTNAQVIQAVQGLATDMKRVLLYLAKQVT